MQADRFPASQEEPNESLVDDSNSLRWPQVLRGKISAVQEWKANGFKEGRADREHVRFDGGFLRLAFDVDARSPLPGAQQRARRVACGDHSGYGIESSLQFAV